MKKQAAKKDFKTLQKEADLSPMFGTQQFFNPYVYYYKLYRKFPHRHWCKDINKSKLLDLLSRYYDLAQSAVFETRIHSKTNKNPLYGVSAYILSKELMLCFPPWEFGNSNDVQLYYSDTVTKTSLQRILNIIKECYMSAEAEKKEVRLLMQNNDNQLDFSLMSMHTTMQNIEPYYNDDLLPLNTMLLQRLNKLNDKGLVIFYGKPGTGKTSYIRYLCSQINKQKLFVPGSLTKKLGSAEFLNLLKDYKNSLLFIEDADALLRKRTNDEDHVIANLVNLSDGILSDFFHVQVICTFNSDIAPIDPTLMRKGRLIAKYNFRELSLEKTLQLSKLLGHKVLPAHEMTLADILHLGEKEYQPSLNTKGLIGFK